MEKANPIRTCVSAEQLASESFQSIDTVTNLSIQYMTYASMMLGALAFIGIGIVIAVVRWYVKVESKRCAEQRIAEFINNGKAQELFRVAVEDAVRIEMSARIFTTVSPTSSQGGNPVGRFQADPRLRGR